METNVFLTTAYEISAECRVPSAEHFSAFAFSLVAVQFSVEIDGDAPLIAFAEAFDA